MRLMNAVVDRGVIKNTKGGVRESLKKRVVTEALFFGAVLVVFASLIVSIWFGVAIEGVSIFAIMTVIALIADYPSYFISWLLDTKDV